MEKSLFTSTQSTEKTVRQIEFLSDMELLDDDVQQLDCLETMLSEQEELLLKEIIDLQNKVNERNSLFHDVLLAAKKGAMDYIDSMTDTGDTFDEMKNSHNVSQWNNTPIDIDNKPATKDATDNWKTRTMSDARSNPIDNNATNSTTGMSTEGLRKWKRYNEAYSQRTKSLTQLSKDGNTVKRSNTNANFETLSGLRGYRIGPVVPMPTAQQAKNDYNQYRNNGGQKSASNWLYDCNMKEFDTVLAKQLGFKSATEAKNWRMENHLTVHEGPDGMFMVPRDVHDAARHDGYRSMMSKCINGEMSEAEIQSYIRQEKIAYVKHEVTERGTRMAKGIGLSAVKDIVKHSIVIICEETYHEFQKESKDSFFARVKSILQKCWESVKSKIMHIISNLWNNIKGSILAELLTALNDFLFGTFKRIFKIVRQMWGSIKNAFKIICSQGTSWEDKVFECTKILSSGIVGILGFSLNEMIEKGLTSIGFPFASFVAECLSGLFAGIMSALVLMIFDRIKQNYKTPSPYMQMCLANSRIVCIEGAKLSISTLKTDMQMRDTWVFVNGALQVITKTRTNIQKSWETGEDLKKAMEIELKKQKQGTRRLGKLLNENLHNKKF